MKLHNPIVVPDKDRKPFFDGDNLKSGEYQFLCSSCNKKTRINCFSIYTGAWSKHFSSEACADIESFFGISLKHNYSMSGGWPSLTMHYCIYCGYPHIVLADFDEYRNSVYAITIQGIAPCW